MLAVLALGLTILGADKSPATRALQRFLSRGRTTAVTSAEIADGYRMAGTDAGGPVEMPAGAATNDLLRRRGGYDWAFRVEPGGWRFPYRDGALTGVTVLVRGEVRPDVGTPYFPVPVTNGVSLLPEARWGLLPDGGASVFSHAVTTNGSLLLDWRSALVGRDPNAPTNLQMELFRDGRFAWRTDGGSTSYLPVLPFDWDNDGLENSVDPEPLVPNPVDAHGTPAEWYRIVCSNVFTTADNSNNQTFPNSNIPTFPNSDISFRTNANPRAYYFVDVVASEGPAPIYFNADRGSRLGSPVVIARAGETNRVPLLVGVGYAVTSAVPFSVTLLEGSFAEVDRRDERSCAIRWPLDFRLDEEVSAQGRSYTVNVTPYDPGGEFTWDGGVDTGGGARLLSASPGPSCVCYAGVGNVVTFSCSPTCTCDGECVATGEYRVEAALFAVTGGVCRCGFDDPEHGDGGEEPPMGPFLEISFSHPVVIYEDAYQNSPGVWKPRRSTRVCLSVHASGGLSGGTLALSHVGLERLLPVGCGPVFLPAQIQLAPCEVYEMDFLCEGASASVCANDVVVAGTFTENGTGLSVASEADLTVVRVVLSPEVEIRNCPHRHILGVREQVECSWFPTGVDATLVASEDDGEVKVKDGKWCYTAPLTVSSRPGLLFSVGGLGLPMGVEVKEPRAILARSAEALGYGLPAGCAGGAGMELDLVVVPTNVSFQGISVQEIPDDYRDPSGYFANPWFEFAWSHTVERRAGVWHPIQAHNRFMLDIAEFGDRLPRMSPQGEITDDERYGWTDGNMSWRIPVGWNASTCCDDDPPVKVFTTYWQHFTMDADGTVGVEKLGYRMSRSTNNVVRLNGIVQESLKPRE